MKVPNRRLLAFFATAAFALALCALPQPAFAAVIPLDSRIAVAVSGGYWVDGDVNIAVADKFSRFAESALRRDLRAAGFKNISATSLTRKQRAILEGGGAASLARSQKVQFLLCGNITEDGADLNSFGTFTTSVSMTLQIVSASSGEYVFDGISSAKAVGGTREEATRKAVEKASRDIAAQIAGDF